MIVRENKQSTNIYKPNLIERAWDGAIGLFSGYCIEKLTTDEH